MTTEEYIKLLENNNKFYEEYKKNYLKADILQRRINKAIEYINEKLNINSDYVDYDFGTALLRNELLEILQGDDKKWN